MFDTAVALVNPNRSAPPVSYPVGRSFVCMAVLVCATVLAVLMQVALFLSWGLPTPLAPAAWWACNLLWLTSLGWAWHRWHQTPVGWLSWAPDTSVPTPQSAHQCPDNAGWWWSDAQGAVGQHVRRVQPAMVFNQWMLLQVRLAPASATATWMWVEARALPPRWLAWRRAVLAHAR